MKRLLAWLFRRKQRAVMTKTQVPEQYWRPIVQDWNKWGRGK